MHVHLMHMHMADQAKGESGCMSMVVHTHPWRCLGCTMACMGDSSCLVAMLDVLMHGSCWVHVMGWRQHAHTSSHVHASSTCAMAWLG